MFEDLTDEELKDAFEKIILEIANEVKDLSDEGWYQWSRRNDEKRRRFLSLGKEMWDRDLVGYKGT